MLLVTDIHKVGNKTVFHMVACISLISKNVERTQDFEVRALVLPSFSVTYYLYGLR
jgi:hypothetical protein